MTQSLLQQTLSAIESERKEDFDKSFLLVEKLLKQYGEENLAECLYNDIPEDCLWEVVADLFAILVWDVSDDGAAALLTATDQWLLKGNNLRKIKIALHLDIYPFRNEPKMREVLTDLASRYPAIAQQCNDFIASRKD